MRPAACIRFNGALGNSSYADYFMLARSWEKARGEPYPLTFPRYMQDVLPSADDPGDLFVATDAVLTGNLGMGMEALRQKHAGVWDEGAVAYRYAKHQIMHGNDKWPGLLIVYAGAQSMLEQLKRMDAAVCVTGEHDGDLLRHIMGCRGLDAGCVIGGDEGKGTEAQLAKLVKWGIEPPWTVYYDRSRANLGVAKGMGFHVLEAVHEDGPRRRLQASPDDFPDVFEEVLGVGANRSRATYC